MSGRNGIPSVKPDWDEAKERFKAWWNRSSLGRPAINIRGRRAAPLAPFSTSDVPTENFDRHAKPAWRHECAMNSIRSHVSLAEAFPNIDINFGPGSLATYVGSEPVFAPDTVWYTHVVDDWRTAPPITFNPQSKWFQTHLRLTKELHALSNGQYLVSVPDLIENLDILSSLREPQTLCLDLLDVPELVKRHLQQVDDVYMNYYNAFYDAVKADDGSCCYVAFQIWGPGKTAKVQCDFSAMIGPDQFREFVQPSLRRQCAALDNTLYHLDGMDAIRHLDAVMEIEELDALQFTSGAGKPDSSDPCWDAIHDKVRKAGKSLWIAIHPEGGLRTAVENAKRLTRRHGRDGLYLLFFVDMSEAEAREIVKNSERWG